jgi:hypothetical protein
VRVGALVSAATLGPPPAVARGETTPSLFD